MAIEEDVSREMERIQSSQCGIIDQSTTTAVIATEFVLLHEIEDTLDREMERLKSASRGHEPVIYFNSLNGTHKEIQTPHGNIDYHREHYLEWIVSDAHIEGFERNESTGVVAFGINVRAHDGSHWRVWRRYSMFHEVRVVHDHCHPFGKPVDPG